MKKGKVHLLKLGQRQYELQYPPLVWFTLTFAVLLIGIAALYAGYEFFRHVALDLGGSQTEGTVIDQVLHEHDDHIEHHITFQFEDRTSTQTVTETFYTEHPIGESVIVTYLSSQPTINRIESTLGERLYLLGATAALIIAFVWLSRWIRPRLQPSS